MPRDSNAPPLGRGQPSQPPAPPPPKRSAAGVAAAIAAACLICAPLATRFEGYRGRAYYDPAHILTVCYGETAAVDPARIYSRDECAAKLRSRLARDYAPALLKCRPELGDLRLRFLFGTLLDAAYNAGTAAVCKSPMAQAVRDHRWIPACLAFRGWFVTAKNRQTGQRMLLPGLVARRDQEAATCIVGEAGVLADEAAMDAMTRGGKNVA